MATSTAPAHRATPSYGHTYRHHPYAPPRSNPKYQQQQQQQQPQQPQQQQQQQQQPAAPASPRSPKDRETSASPINLSVAFGQSAGGKWWDEELPAPPSSLNSILESFRKSGEGDRELLLSILGAKKAEEERLTALIQTRLTILQARLSLHTNAAQLNVAGAAPATCAPTIERTPSLGASSRGSASSSTGPISPMGTVYSTIPNSNSGPAKLASEKAVQASYFHLPPPSSMIRHTASSSPEHRDNRLPPVRGSLSPRSSASDGSRAPGLDMLLDAGMEKERRESVSQ